MLTLGELIDRLSIVNIKLWFAQQELQDAAECGEGLEAKTAKRLVVLNRQRNQIVEAIDRMASSGEFPMKEQIKL